MTTHFKGFAPTAETLLLHRSPTNRVMAKRVLDLREGSSSNLKIKKEKQAVLSPSKISPPAPHTTVDTLVALLSPPPKSGRYFDGELTDGEKVIRLIGFRKAQRDILESYYKKKLAVTLEGCRVQFNQANKKREVVTKDYTKYLPLLQLSMSAIRILLGLNTSN